MLTYPCAHCSELVTLDTVDWIDNGTTLFCPQCDGPTVVELRRGVRAHYVLVSQDEGADYSGAGCPNDTATNNGALSDSRWYGTPAKRERNSARQARGTVS